LFVVAVVSVVLRPGVGGGFGGELLLLELISEPPSLAHPAVHFSFGLFGVCVVWFGLLAGAVQNAAGEDRTPDLRIMRPTRCQLRYCRMCLHCGGAYGASSWSHLLCYCSVLGVGAQWCCATGLVVSRLPRWIRNPTVAVQLRAGSRAGLGMHDASCGCPPPPVSCTHFAGRALVCGYRRCQHNQDLVV
jgi:hypothetical protein